MLPSYFREPVFLCAEQHLNHALIQPVSLDFATQQTAVPIGLSEFRIAATQYPIVFIGDNHPVPVIVTGLLSGGNLFIDQSGKWDSQHYCPAFLKQYPFYMLPQKGNETGILLADQASKSFSDKKYIQIKASADSLFTKQGDASEALMRVVALCAGVYHAKQQVTALGHAIKAAGVLVERNVQYSAEKNTQTISGMLMVDENALRSLPEATLIAWYKSGWIDALNMHLASQHNWEKLVHRHTQTSRNKAGGR